VVLGRSPFDPNRHCQFRVAKDDAIRAGGVYRRNSIFQIWSIVFGQPPPVPNVNVWARNAPADVGLVSLVQAHACFRGINRALAEDDSGDNVVAYILKPKLFYEYEANLVCVAVKNEVPQDVVYAAYVRLDLPFAENGSPVKGVFTHGGFVEADPATEYHLPIDFNSRYKERLW
jgi:hypothetical protein